MLPFTPPGLYRNTRLPVEYLMVGGGAGRGAHTINVSTTGGPGAGGEVLTGAASLAPGSYAVTVGVGGPKGSSSFGGGTQGQDGGNTTFSADPRTAHGGSGGGGEGGTPAGRNGTLGGGAATVNGALGGTGTLHSGGAGQAGATGGAAGSGGNGGNSSSPTSPGVGGLGVTSSISGSPVMYGMGGPGAFMSGGTPNALNYANGGAPFPTPSIPGTGGAADATDQSGDSGRDGVFILSYPGPQRGTGGTVTSAGGHTIHTFSSSGTFSCS